MKKIFFTVIFTAIVMTSANAQKIGIKGGLNFSKYNNSEVNTSLNKEGFKTLVGFTVGGFAEFEISDKFVFQPEILFSTQGDKYSYSEYNFDGRWSREYLIKTSYINVSLIAKYYVVDGLNIQLGPQVGFLMSANKEDSYSEDGFPANAKRDVKKDMKAIDYGLNFGAGYKFENGLMFDFRYNIGLSDLAIKRDASDNNKTFNRVIQFSIGYSFSL